ncbi:hypothetical protein D910_05247 [Dendroctonus ponderosae]|uniref:Uncharacterized protein n=1 Tax=Dendroctonus ponderosae TaxID=77166 RepID=U4U1Z5_DENPD|nr:hypothetical protein D910_05247 [Dendroctonus ponderosae]
MEIQLRTRHYKNLPQPQLISPCPKIFQYETRPEEPDRWYGTAVLTGSQDLVGVWFRVVLDSTALQLGHVGLRVVVPDRRFIAQQHQPIVAPGLPGLHQRLIGASAPALRQSRNEHGHAPRPLKTQHIGVVEHGCQFLLRGAFAALLLLLGAT